MYLIYINFCLVYIEIYGLYVFLWNIKSLAYVKEVALNIRSRGSNDYFMFSTYHTSE